MTKTAQALKELADEVAKLREQVEKLRFEQHSSQKIVYVPQPYPVYQPYYPYQQPYPWYIYNGLHQQQYTSQNQLGNTQLQITGGS